MQPISDGHTTLVMGRQAQGWIDDMSRDDLVWGRRMMRWSDSAPKIERWRGGDNKWRLRKGRNGPRKQERAAWGLKEGRG